MLKLSKSAKPNFEEAVIAHFEDPKYSYAVYVAHGTDYYKVVYDTKRKPLKDGTLPLTHEELAEFCEVVCEDAPVTKVTFGGVIVKYTTPYETTDLCDMQGIQYLLERFDLTEV